MFCLEFCKYEFLTCRRNTSACSYICTYQNLGEVPAYLIGWLQLLGRSSCVTLIARALGSVLTQVVGDRLVRHHFAAQWMVAEDTIGIIAQFIVGLFILLGLKVGSGLCLGSLLERLQSCFMNCR